MKLYMLLGLFILSNSVFANCPAWLNHSIDRLHSNKTVNLCEVVQNKPVLIVNTASHCGYTKQFKGLEALHQQYKTKGLVVIGFPSDSFNQEASQEAETAEVCYKNFGVSFLMSKPILVKGKAAHPIFKTLNQQQGEPAWNFNKYLVDANGQVVKRFDSWVKPSASALTKEIEAVL